jgi:hypothetical protein
MIRPALGRCFVLALAACGSPETSQANNAQANMSATASSPATATPNGTGPAGDRDSSYERNALDQ